MRTSLPRYLFHLPPYVSESGDQPTGLTLLGRMAVLALTPGDLTCAQRDLCRVVRGGRLAGPPYSTALPLARCVSDRAAVTFLPVVSSLS